MVSLADANESPDERRLRFLLDEGLDLLAAFRTISNPEKRREIMTIVRQAAAEEGVIRAAETIQPIASSPTSDISK